MDTQYALYSGAILCVTGIMYLVLSWACESIVKSSASTAPAYAISSVYYLFLDCRNCIQRVNRAALYLIGIFSLFWRLF